MYSDLTSVLSSHLPSNLRATFEPNLVPAPRACFGVRHLVTGPFMSCQETKIAMWKHIVPIANGQHAVYRLLLDYHKRGHSL